VLEKVGTFDGSPSGINIEGECNSGVREEGVGDRMGSMTFKGDRVEGEKLVEGETVEGLVCDSTTEFSCWRMLSKLKSHGSAESTMKNKQQLHKHT